MMFQLFIKNYQYCYHRRKDFYKDHEIHDAYLVYAHSPARKGKTLHVSSDELREMLTKVRKYQGHAASHLNLVFLGHATYRTNFIASMDAADISTLVADHDNISRVTLLGCHTATVAPTEKEKRMTEKYQDTLKSPKYAHSAVMLMSYLPNKDQYDGFFKKMSTDSKGRKTDTLFILINNSSSKKPAMLMLKKDSSTGSISMHSYDNLTDESMVAIKKLIGSSSGKIPIPSNKNPIIYYRGGKSAEFLTQIDSEKLLDVLNENEPRFSKRHPQYKEDKQMFPFMTGLELEESEEDKISPSLLKHVKDAIKSEPRITREITVKGYNKAVHVDTKERQMKVYETHLYKSEYSGKDRSTFFSELKDNIDRKKLADARKREMEKMAKGELGEESIAKSIIVRVKKQ